MREKFVLPFLQCRRVEGERFLNMSQVVDGPTTKHCRCSTGVTVDAAGGAVGAKTDGVEV